MHPAIHASFFSSLLLMLALVAPYAATFMIRRSALRRCAIAEPVSARCDVMARLR